MVERVSESDSLPLPGAGVRAWATFYTDRGLQSVPLAPGTKAPTGEGWIRLVFKPEDFRDGDNIGLRSVNGLVITDLDCEEVVALADAFLPATGAVYGRPSKPRSKRLYLSKFEKTIPFKDLVIKESGKAMLAEIRSNHQDMAPPSRHPDGELLAWDGPLGTIAEVAQDVLVRSMRLLTTCAQVARYYNGPGDRHEWCLALAGMFRRFGITEDEAHKIIEHAGRWARDPRLDDRFGEISSTYGRDEAEPVTGARTLAELSREGTPFVRCGNGRRSWPGSKPSCAARVRHGRTSPCCGKPLSAATPSGRPCSAASPSGPRAGAPHAGTANALEGRARARVDGAV